MKTAIIVSAILLLLFIGARVYISYRDRDRQERLLVGGAAVGRRGAAEIARAAEEAGYQGNVADLIPPEFTTAIQEGTARMEEARVERAVGDRVAR